MQHTAGPLAGAHLVVQRPCEEVHRLFGERGESGRDRPSCGAYRDVRLGVDAQFLPARDLPGVAVERRDRVGVGALTGRSRGRQQPDGITELPG